MRLGEQNRLIFAGAVQVEFLADPAIAVGDAVIITRRNKLQDEPTAALNRLKGSTAPLRMADAYLIINGRRHVVLEKAVNTIGRSLENDVVIEDQGVSRRHAQIRWRNGRFEIFDLGSRAGIVLNRRRISRAELKSGDVIALGSAALIFGQEESNEPGGDPETNRLTEVTQELSADDLP
jgi:pSer/pThr/pTyr-binding forkhead associated (FHA) protein